VGEALSRAFDRIQSGNDADGRVVTAAERRRRDCDGLSSHRFPIVQEMLTHVDALSFAVPPDVQAEMAIVGALAGKALLLEKPIALDLGQANELARVIDETGVPTQLVLTWRYAPRVRSFLDAVRHCEPLGGRGRFLTGGFLGGMFATPWRIERGPLWDLGPHVIDLLDAALRTHRRDRSLGDLHRWIDLHLVHASGIVSQASITAYSRLDPSRAGVAIYHPDGVLEVDTTAVSQEAAPVIASEFAAAVRNRQSHTLDVHRGLYIQNLLTSGRGKSQLARVSRAAPRPGEGGQIGLASWSGARRPTSTTRVATRLADGQQRLRHSRPLIHRYRCGRALASAKQPRSQDPNCSDGVKPVARNQRQDCMPLTSWLINSGVQPGALGSGCSVLQSIWTAISSLPIARRVAS